MSRDLNLRLMRRREIVRKLRRAAASKKAMAAYAQGYLTAYAAAEAIGLDDVGFISVVRSTHAALSQSLGHHVQPDGDAVSPLTNSVIALNFGVFKRALKRARQLFFGRHNV